MAARVAGGVLALVLALAAALVLWQPDALQRKILSVVEARVAETTPYQLSVGSVSGNFFQRFTLHDVRLRAKDGADLLTAEKLRLGLGWSDLLHKRIEVRQIKLVRPVMRLTLGPDKKLRLPAMAPSPKKPSPALPFYVNLLEIEDGRLLFRNESLSPAREVTLAPIDLSASIDPKAFSLSSLKTGLSDGTLEASGTIVLAKPFPTSLRMMTRRFPLHRLLSAFGAVPEPLVLTHSGRFNVSGEGTRWRVTSDGQLDNSPLTIRADLQTTGPYKAFVKLDPLPVDHIWRDPSKSDLGEVSLALTASAPAFASKAITLSGNARLEGAHLRGIRAPTVWMNAALVDGRGPLIIRLRDEGLQGASTTQFDLAKHRIDSRFAVTVTSFSALAKWVPALKGADGVLSATGTARGALAAPVIDVEAEGNQWTYKGREIQSLTLSVRGGLGANDRLDAKGVVKNAVLQKGIESPWDIVSADLAIDKKQKVFHPTLSAHFRNDATFTYGGTFQSQSKGWTLAWDTLAFAPPGGPTLAANEPGRVESHADGALEIQRLMISDGKGQIELPEGTLERNKTLRARLAVHELAVAPLARVFAPEKVLDGVLNADVQLAGPLRGPAGHLNVTWADGHLQNFAFKKITLDAVLAPPWILVRPLSIVMQNIQNDIQGGGKIPMHLLDPSQPDLPWDVTIQAPHLDPQLLTAVVPTLAIDKGGQASFKLKIAGRYPEFTTDGIFTAQLPRLQVKNVGLDLKDVQADVRSAGKTVEIRQFVGKTKKGDLAISGKSELPNLNFKIEGTDVVLDKPKEIEARLDVSGLIGGDLEGPDISGKISIKEGTYTRPKATKKDKKKAREEKAARQKREREALTKGGEPSVWQGTTMDIQAQWPRGVWYRDGLSKIETNGDVRIQKEEGTGGLYMSGSINILRGSYNAFSHDFILNSGQIIFTGPPDINPTLNVQTQYASGGYVVYLAIKGTAKQPQPILTSNPPMSEQDIISVLVTGQPLNRIGPGQTAETSRSQQAAALAATVASGYLTQELRENGMDVGLDVMRVEPTTGGNRLTVGRYIGDKLFVSYGQPLQSSAQRVFDASYYLHKFWMLLGETGSSADSHMDIQFRYPLNAPPGSMSNYGNQTPMPEIGPQTITGGQNGQSFPTR